MNGPQFIKARGAQKDSLGGASFEYQLNILMIVSVRKNGDTYDIQTCLSSKVAEERFWVDIDSDAGRILESYFQ